MGNAYGGEAETERSVNVPETPKETLFEEESNDLPEEEKAPIEANLQQETAETEPAEEENTDAAPSADPPSVIFPEGEATASASFFARVFTGEGTYPVTGAKVVVYRGDNIYAFLETDENGRTKSVKLPAFSESNSLEPENENQSIAYNADIFAPGFTSRKGLLVSAVGGSEIVLNVLLVPEEEGLS